MSRLATLPWFVSHERNHHEFADMPDANLQFAGMFVTRDKDGFTDRVRPFSFSLHYAGSG